MTLADTGPPSRRAVRADTGGVVLGEPAPSPEQPVDPSDARLSPTPAAAKVAFSWVDEESVAQTALSPRETSAAGGTAAVLGPDLLAKALRRSPWRAGVLVPFAIIVFLFAGYAATTLLWPLTAVTPTIEAVAVQAVPSAVTTPAWPVEGSGAVAVQGFDGTVASTQDAAPIASITKVVTALLVLEEMPLALGEQGPEYRFTSNDRSAYWGYRSRGESALDVPAGGTLTEYQLLEGMLIGSANNYADRLASNLWPNDAVFARAADDWLEAHGVPGITIAEPTGFDRRNTASAAALIPLAQKALANPVIAEIVAKREVDLPGAGRVTNTNGLLADPGVIGVKTGSLDDFNLLAAKNITVGDTPVRLYASVLGQPDDPRRVEATRALFAQLESELQVEPSVPVGTTVGTVDTAWGDRADVVTDADASVVLWNGAAGTTTTDLELGDLRDAGDVVGSLSVTGPLNTATVEVSLDGDIEPPSAWWRLTHPLELFGLAG
ncbi:D-alanyl-D-alanine carboxypeptidase [Microbacterium sp. BK668]|uniref:D-alanyl-D-alanine carboxypeptidase family protein n=1 Tax=Microbacterium sp. BK668 TaxID=2512118 RepID=UPI00105D0229|nr:D-alanyl-D-alanine carboxypeptidase [Microbacterium sp. BK668]TDN91353.1 D-alanyl-D-alanine carboxypeptidase (penicillin-binding protein 5/6) [Microbacterium sp. BK668]